MDLTSASSINKKGLVSETLMSNWTFFSDTYLKLKVEMDGFDTSSASFIVLRKRWELNNCSPVSDTLEVALMKQLFSSHPLNDNFYRRLSMGISAARILELAGTLITLLARFESFEPFARDPDQLIGSMINSISTSVL